MDGQVDLSLAIVPSSCDPCYVKNNKVQQPYWFVIIVPKDGMRVVLHHHLWRFQHEIGYVHDAPNKHGLLFCVNLL
jgi:hypothetical protein